MNLSWIPPDHREAERIESDPEGYADFQARQAVRELIRLHGRTKTEFLLSAIFEDEAGRLIV